jgi:phosphoglycolate phosphatase
VTHPTVNQRQFDLMIFDWDGTLFDSTAIIAEAIQRAVVDVGGRDPGLERASHVIGLGLRQALEWVAPDMNPSQYPELARRYAYHYERRADDLHLFPGILEMLLALKQAGYQLAIATGKSRRGLDLTMAQLPVDGLFCASRTADQTEGKPSPRMLLELMQECGCGSHNTLMVGDTTHDLQMALNAGCAAVGVSYGAHPLEQLTPLGPLFIADSPKDLHQGLLQYA